ncbi:MAG: glycogen/starch/alpha-glucan phosphorylase [Gammaproteobacteria bacterium]|nr:glycogen/starch/alpha-glucan phosphorylase [Gammaproteobacteria bacterium]
MEDKNLHSEPASDPQQESIRTGLSQPAMMKAFSNNLFYMQGRSGDSATPNDLYMAAAYTVRDRMLKRWVHSAQTYKEKTVRRVCYLSAEFLLGPHLANNLINLGIMEKAQDSAIKMGMDFEQIITQEEEPGLGNGGLGRLAACYLDSLATLQIPAIGYGIRYEFGIFDQVIEDGWQVEVSDTWLRNGNPWELARPELHFPVNFGGHIKHFKTEHGADKVEWIPDLCVNGVAYDTPILGYGVNNCNTLRLWKAEAPKSFDFQAFNTGDYYGAIEAKVIAENISKVLYPNDEKIGGKELRLKQQYFFVCCSLQDMIRKHTSTGETLDTFHEKFAVQLNDTHPAIAIAELLRIFLDEQHMNWEAAWNICRKTFAFTNHTLLPEALETWSVKLFKQVLPRHLELIYEINSHFMDEVRMHFLNDQDHLDRLARMSLINDSGEKSIRMAHLACVGSHAINGVAQLHSELLKSTTLSDFYHLWPEKFSNKTNGVTPRRFLVLSNPKLSKLITTTLNCSDCWVRDMTLLKGLEAYANNSDFHNEWRTVKTAAKNNLANWINLNTGLNVDPQSLFDVQVKRIHEYKRQHLNILHVITLYRRIKQDPSLEITPRTFIFGGKAAPAYHLAKLMIKLITAVGDVINNDPQVNGLLRVAFIPNFNVKNAQLIYPAADLSEQISTAGKEASGTGNMKFSMNGALTIGTLDGANIEIRKEVGADNFFLFGLTAQEVAQEKANGYKPESIINTNKDLKNALELIDCGLFSHGEQSLFKPLTDSLKYDDPFLVCADYQSYIDCQAEVSHAFHHQEHWTRMSILNVARIGKFSSDRAIKEYCDDIWKAKPVPVDIT